MRPQPTAHPHYPFTTGSTPPPPSPLTLRDSGCRSDPILKKSHVVTGIFQNMNLF